MAIQSREWITFAEIEDDVRSIATEREYTDRPAAELSEKQLHENSATSAEASRKILDNALKVIMAFLALVAALAVFITTIWGIRTDKVVAPIRAAETRIENMEKEIKDTESELRRDIEILKSDLEKDIERLEERMIERLEEKTRNIETLKSDLEKDIERLEEKMNRKLSPKH